jgi:lysine-N-methylase
VDPDDIFVRTRGRHRLGHQSDGRCVFLDGAGRCRIHTRFGESAKPLACRLFPFAIHPAGAKLVLSLRFSCPSVASNHGPPLTPQRQDLQQLARATVPAHYREVPPPRLLRQVEPPWPVFLRYVAWLGESVGDNRAPMALKLMRLFACLKAIESARADRLPAGQPDQWLAPLWRDVSAKLPTLPQPVERPSRFGFILFRILLFEYARRETIAGGPGTSWSSARTLQSLGRVLRAQGQVPALRPEWTALPFAAVEQPFGPLPLEAEAALTRFFRVKIEGLHFCGRSQDGLSFVEGFYGLALLYPVMLWLSRCYALSEKRDAIRLEDVTRAIMAADHHYGYSARLSSRPFRKIVGLLAQRDDVALLCGWYGR